MFWCLGITKEFLVVARVLLSQVKLLCIALYTIQIVSKQLHSKECVLFVCLGITRVFWEVARALLRCSG